jgi:hypothetical protein
MGGAAGRAHSGERAGWMGGMAWSGRGGGWGGLGD